MEKLMSLSDFCARCDDIREKVVIGLLTGDEAMHVLNELWDVFVEVNYGTL